MKFCVYEGLSKSQTILLGRAATVYTQALVPVRLPSAVHHFHSFQSH
jgi:hypothetical protein